MAKEIDLTRIIKQNGKVKTSVIVDNPIIADEVMVNKVRQFSEDKYDQITQALKENPFMPSEGVSEFEVISIDEYYFTYKNETMNLRGVITNNKYSNYEKKKIIKYVFKNWIKDYRALERESTTSIKEQLSLLEDVEYKRFSFWLILIFLVVFGINMILLFVNQTNITVPFIIKANKTLKNTLGQNQLLEHLTVVMLAINFLVLTFGLYHNKVLREYRKQYLLSKQNVQELYSNMKRAFMSKARKARRYYLKNFKKKNYKPYPINKIDLEEYSVKNVKAYAQVATTYTVAFKKLGKRFHHWRLILLWGGSAMMIGYYLYLAITILF